TPIPSPSPIPTPTPSPSPSPTPTPSPSPSPIPTPTPSPSPSPTPTPSPSPSPLPTPTPVPKTLQVILAASPKNFTGFAEGVDLTAQVSGTAVGNINYTFYCNRADEGVSVTSGYAHKADASALTLYTILDVC